MALRVTVRHLFLASAAIAVLAVGAVWLERLSIARRFADAELRARAVDASYTITAIGPRTQRIENIVIGDPADPDFVARWMEVELGAGLGGVSLRALRARGVRMKARFSDGRLSLGTLDRLLPRAGDGPFALPDLALDLADARIRVDSDFGTVLADIGGRGNPTGQFNGAARVYAPRLASGGVIATQARAELDIRAAANALVASGPVAIGSVNGDGFALSAIAGRMAAESDGGLRQPRGNFQLVAQPDRLPAITAKRLIADGRIGLAPGGTTSVGATLRLADARPSGASLRNATTLLPALPGTPLEPLLAELRKAVGSLGRGSTVTADIAMLWSARDGGSIRISPAVRSASGAWLRSMGEGMGYDLSDRRWSVNDRFMLSGGGFPDLQMQIVSTDRGWAGQASMRPYAAGDARIALTPFRFALTDAGLGLQTSALVDGPLAGGRVTGLRVPLALRPGRAPLQGCFAPSFRTLDVAALRLGPHTLPLCISGDRARMAALRLAGRLGASPFALRAGVLEADLAGGGFALRAPALRLGPPESQTSLDAADLSGAFSNGGAEGRFTGLSGAIASVPLRASDGAGRWAFRNGTLTASGSLRVADTAAEPRFFPLVADDFALRLADGQVRATATAREPRSGRAITAVDVRHALGPGTGEAILTVDRLQFDERLQPEMVTPITLGVIANVRGTLDGAGVIRWTPAGVRSTGGFRTSSLDLAAAFGPVTGISGEIGLSDLLGLETGERQTVRIAGINPGIAVVDGEIGYRLLPGLRAAIDGGRWPFAGGTLILEPTVMDLSAEAERRLTFRVEGLDAAKFVAEMQFENIAATGRFDGILPMIFDQNGGRIEGGTLVARGEGTLSYIGEVSNENLGMMGSFAFDALKSMKYERLTIGLDGPLDGDVVTRIALKGVNQAPLGAPRARLPVPVAIRGVDNLPFLFNITITAPFRRLFRMAQTIADPSLLVEQITPELERVGPARTLPPADKAVQPAERR